MRFDIRCKNKKFNIDADNMVEALLKLIDDNEYLENFLEFDVTRIQEG
jgi:hypothetical protein